MEPCAKSKELPRRKHIRLPSDAYYKSETWYFVTICCRGKKPLFQKPLFRNMIAQTLRETATTYRVELAAYTILPNHVPIVCSAGRGLVEFIRAIKGRASKAMRTAGFAQSPWQKSFFDHKLRSQESLRQKCLYVWMNPVRRGLAKKTQDYPWSGTLLTD